MGVNVRVTYRYYKFNGNCEYRTFGENINYMRNMHPS